LRGPAGTLGLGFLTDRQCLQSRSPEGLWQSALSGPVRNMTELATHPGPLRRAPVRCAMVTPGVDRVGNARAAYDPLTGRGVPEALRNALETASSLGQDRRLAEKRLGQHYAQYLEECRRLYELGAARFGTGFWQRRTKPPEAHRRTR
jgi:flavin-dependent dehydrogenase